MGPASSGPAMAPTLPPSRPTAAPQGRRRPPSPAVHRLAPDEGGEGRAEEVERRGHARPRHPSAEFRADDRDDGEDGDRGRRAEALRDEERAAEGGRAGGDVDQEKSP